MTDPLARVPILILAAGQSRRMRGRDKLLEPVDGQPLLRRQVEIAREATQAPVVVTLPLPSHPRYGALDGAKGIQIVPVPDAEEGMSASLRRGIASVGDAAEAVMILLADLPDLTTDDLRAVLAAVDTSGETLIWRGATESGAPGHPIVFARALFAPLMALTGDAGGAAIVSAHAKDVALIRLPDDHARRDLDTPEDWAAWRRDCAR